MPFPPSDSSGSPALAITRRILLVHQDPAMHRLLREMLQEFDLRGRAQRSSPTSAHATWYEVSVAEDAAGGVGLVELAVASEHRFALAFVEANAHTGYAGIEAIRRMWAADPDLEVVLLVDAADAEWERRAVALPAYDRILSLALPTPAAHLRHLTFSLAEKWGLRQQAQATMDDLNAMVARRTEELQRAYDELRRESAERAQVEQELRLAQKLEAVGRLAAGIAHEINTPIQFVGDHAHFAADAVASLDGLIRCYREVLNAAVQDGMSPALLERVRVAETEADLAFVVEQLPQSFSRITEGLERVAVIVRSMKDFAHPGGPEREAVDLERLVRATAEMARHETKAVAEVHLDLAAVPPILAHRGEIGQVLLNLLVNAAQAIGTRLEGGGAASAPAPGDIRVRTGVTDGMADLWVEDNGCGIPDAIRERIFDPFFTTKPVGVGSGQGLALARSIVVDRHQGTLTCASTPGEGTRFHVRLPLA